MSRVVYINSIVSILHGVVSYMVSSLNMVNLPYAAWYRCRYPTNPTLRCCPAVSDRKGSQCLPKSVTENVTENVRRQWRGNSGETGKAWKIQLWRIRLQTTHSICKCLSPSACSETQPLRALDQWSTKTRLPRTNARTVRAHYPKVDSSWHQLATPRAFPADELLDI